MFYLEISGIDSNDEQPLNIPLIVWILLIFHLEISGIDDNNKHLPNI